MELKFLLELIVETRFHKAHQMFQKDTQTITAEALENVKAALASSEIEQKTEAKKRAIPRKVSGQSWEDPTLSECPEIDFRLFCGDIGNEVNDDVLVSKAFARFPTFNMAKVALILALFTLCLAIGATSTPVLTIKSPDGDLIDCVERTAQPSFSHPLLKDHKLQETPTNLPDLTNDEDEVSWQNWHGSGTKCPKGTIPIRRVIPHKKSTIDSEAGVEVTFGHEYSIGTLNSTPKIYGTKATMSVWHPIVERVEEFSLGQIWVVSGSYNNSDVNTIEAGWQVYPELYFDYQPRFFIFWTNDAYNRTKCYNLRCGGFIQTSRTILIEGAISPASTVGGPQTELTIEIWKDPKLAVWWLGVGLNNGSVVAPVGYWPTNIFTRLTEYADMVQWGGEIVNRNISGRHTTTQMGSGYLPCAKAAYMRDLEVAVNINNSQPVYNLVVDATDPTYYRIKKISNMSFSYGGPEHAGAVHIRSDLIFLYLYLGIFVLF